MMFSFLCLSRLIGCFLNIFRCPKSSLILLLTLLLNLNVPMESYAVKSYYADIMPEESCGTVTDIDGNVYETVLVAGECWIKSNLKVKHYRNGDPIPEIQDQQEWADAKTGAWCYYDNDPANEEKYGLLYNFFAVEDPRGLAPEGWEVPPVCSYLNLMNYYGEEVSGDKIKDPNEWPVNIHDNPDNESGLTVIPAGYRSGMNPDFNGNGEVGNYVTAFWTSMKLSADLSVFASLRHDTPWFALDAISYRSYWGLSVRTTKKKEPPKDPTELIAQEIFQCELGTVYDFMPDFSDLIDRPTCSGFGYIYDSYLCYDLNNVKIFKTDISSEPLEQYDRFEHDVTYYFLLANETLFGGVWTQDGKYHEIVSAICNVEYKAFVFKRPFLPAPEGDAEQFFCSSAKIGDFAVTGEDLVWYESEDSENALSDDVPLENGKKYYVAQRTTGCESGERLEVTARVSQPLPPTGAAIQEFCRAAVVGDLEVEGDNIQWFDTEGILLPLSASLMHNSVYRAVSKEGDCESEAMEISVVLKSTPAPQADAVQRFCFGATLSDIEVSGESVQFYESAEDDNPLDPESLLEFDREYYVSQTLNGCESLEKTSIKVDLKEILFPVTDAVQVFCNSAFINDLVAVGENIKWYKDRILTTTLEAGVALENQELYFVTQTVDGCESSPVEVKVTINSHGKPTGETNQEFCGNANLSDLIITGENIRWYSGQNDTQPINGNIVLEDGRTYWATQTVQGCESADRLEVNVNIYRPDSPAGERSQSVCEGTLLEELNVDGTGLTWYEAESVGSPIAPTTVLEHGRSYFVSQTVGDCVSERLRVRVDILPSLPPIAENQQVFCASSAPTVNDLFAVGEQVIWYVSETGGSPVPEDVQLEDGVSYYASNINSIGCESPVRKRVEVNIQVCEVEVYNLVTLDGNDRNAYFRIKDIEYFPENSLEVFNRYGVLVYAQQSYGQDGNFFFGEPNVSGVRDTARGLPTGNYLYILTYKVPSNGKTEKVSGYLHLINAK